MTPTIPSRCLSVDLKVTLPTLTCKDDILGDWGNLSDFGKALGSIPGQLGNVASCVTDQLRAQIEAAIKSLTDTLDGIMGAITNLVPTPLWPTLTIPEINFELRMGKLWQDFKLYVQQKIYDILANIPLLNFIVDLVNIPIPFLEGVKLFDVFTAEGRARIRAAASDKLASIYSALGLPWNLTWSGSLTLTLPELQLEHVLTKIFSEVEKLLSGVLWNVLTYSACCWICSCVWDAFSASASSASKSGSSIMRPPW
jgi:hypothetical protein